MAADGVAAAVLLVPSLLTGWRVFDFAPGRSLTRGLADAGIDVFVVDWGRPGPWSRDVDWACLADRLRRVLGRPGIIAGMTRFGGLTLIGMGVATAVLRRPA